MVKLFSIFFMAFMCLVIFLTCLKHIFIINVVRAIIRVGKAISHLTNSINFLPKYSGKEDYIRGSKD